MTGAMGLPCTFALFSVNFSQNSCMYTLPFCFSKYETAFGSFFSATYNRYFSDADQTREPNCPINIQINFLNIHVKITVNEITIFTFHAD